MSIVPLIFISVPTGPLIGSMIIVGVAVAIALGVSDAKNAAASSIIVKTVMSEILPLFDKNLCKHLPLISPKASNFLTSVLMDVDIS